MENKDVLDGMSQEIDSKQKRPQFARLAGAMVITVYLLLGMGIIIAMNDMFDGITAEEAFFFLMLSLIMLICAFIIFAISYIDINIEQDIEKETNLRTLLDKSNIEFQEIVMDLLKKNSRDTKKINEFLKEQYHADFDYIPRGKID